MESCVENGAEKRKVSLRIPGPSIRSLVLSSEKMKTKTILENEIIKSFEKIIITGSLLFCGFSSSSFSALGSEDFFSSGDAIGFSSSFSSSFGFDSTKVITIFDQHTKHIYLKNKKWKNENNFALQFHLDRVSST